MQLCKINLTIWLYSMFFPEMFFCCLLTLKKSRQILASWFSVTPGNILPLVLCAHSLNLIFRFSLFTLVLHCMLLSHCCCWSLFKTELFLSHFQSWPLVQLFVLHRQRNHSHHCNFASFWVWKPFLPLCDSCAVPLPFHHALLLHPELFLTIHCCYPFQCPPWAFSLILVSRSQLLNPHGNLAKFFQPFYQNNL